MDTKDEAKTNTKPATVAISGKTRQAAEQAAATWRVATVIRKTAETNIEVTLNLDEESGVAVATGIGFFDHMLNLFAKHGRFGLTVKADGDTYIDAHHTVEDVALALGQALTKALGDKKQIERYGDAWVPMDEALTQVVIDLSGRPYLVFKAELSTPLLGTFETELVEDFFPSHRYERSYESSCAQ